VTANLVHPDTAAKNLAGVFLIGFPDVLIARYHRNRLDGGVKLVKPILFGWP